MASSEGEIVLSRLAAAEEELARTREHPARQREIVTNPESAGRDPGQARQATFEAAEAKHARCLAMLLDELIQRGWKVAQPET
jgi:hypothetical protein